MSKMIKVVLLLGVLFLVYQFFALFFVDRHTAEYSVKTETNSYLIKENYKKTGKFHMYSSLIEDKEHNKFVTSYDVGINRQEQIIKDIKEYKNGNIYCIAPILKDKSIQYIACLENKNQVSLTYLHQRKNNEVDNFILDLKQQGYNVNDQLDIESSIVKTEKNLSLYNSLDDNMYISMWQYRGVTSINRENIIENTYLDKDLYFNTYSILCGRYYVTLNVENIVVDAFYVANIKEGGNHKVEIEDYSISKNIYFNGIYQNKVYFIDIDNKIQYIINPATEKIEKIENDAYYYDGKKMKKIDINELIIEKKQFIPKDENSKLIEKVGNYNFIESYGNYYYLDSDNSVYQIVGVYPEYKVLLFKFDDFKELKVRNNNVFGISGDTVYMYNNTNGLRKVITNRELLYNYKNIYDIYTDK